MKLKAILKQLRGQHTLPAEEQLFSHFPGHEPGGKRGHSKLQPGSGLPPCFVGELPVPSRLWCHCVVDLRGAFKGKHMLDDSDGIFQMDPAEPLFTRPQPGLYTKPKRLRHLPQRAPLFRQHHTETQETHLRTMLSGPAGLFLPRLTQRRRKPCSNVSVLAEGLLICCPVVTNRTRADQPLGGLFKLAHPNHEFSREIHPARYDLPLVGTAPSSIRKARSCEINHNIDRLSAFPKRGNVRRLSRRGTRPSRKNCELMSSGVKRGTGGRANETRATCHQNMHRSPALMSRGNPRASTDVYAS